MAIAVRAVNDGCSFSTNSPVPTIPAAQVTTDMMLVIAAVKPFDAGWSVSGWTALDSGASGSTAAGVDTGSMKAQVWWKEATSDTETNPTVTEGSPVFNIAGAVVAVFSKDVSETWSAPVVVYGADEANGTSVSVTTSADPGVTAGDYAVTFLGVNTDNITPLTGSPAALVATQTGVTFGAFTTHVVTVASWETTFGGDMGMHVASAAVSSGTGSAAPVLTGTGTASGGADMLEAGFIRLRVSGGAAATSLLDSNRMSRWLVVR